MFRIGITALKQVRQDVSKRPELVSHWTQQVVNGQPRQYLSTGSVPPNITDRKFIKLDDVSRLALSNSKKLDSYIQPYQPLGLAPNQGIGILNMGYAVECMVDKFTQRYPNTPLIQISHENIPTHPKIEHRISLKGDSIGAYSDYNAVAKAIKEFNSNIGNKVQLWGLFPGWGLASENFELAETVLAAGAVPLMPPIAAMKQAGNKNEFEATCQRLGLPTLPAMSLPEERLFDEQIVNIEEFVNQHRFGSDAISIMIKSAEGGGGKGMREYNLKTGDSFNPNEVANLLKDAKLEQPGDFLIQEKLTTEGGAIVQHWEQQMFGSVPIGIPRDCTNQKPGFQKQIQLNVSHSTDSELLQLMKDQASLLCKELGYEGAPGTIEFLIRKRGDKIEHYFLEMNTRLQVEHPVTEFSTGLWYAGELYPTCLVGEMVRSQLGTSVIDDMTPVPIKEAMDIRIDFVSPEGTTPWLSQGGFVAGVSKSNNFSGECVIKTGVVGVGDTQVGSLRLTAPLGEREQLFDDAITCLEQVHIKGTGKHNLTFMHTLLQEGQLRKSTISNTWLSTNSSLYCYNPLIEHNVEQQIEAKLRKLVIPKLILGPDATPSGHFLNPSIIEKRDKIVKEIFSRPIQSGSLQDVKAIGWKEYVKQNLLSEFSIKLELRDIIQSWLGNRHTPDLWNQLRQAVSTFREVGDAIKFLEVPSGAALQTRALQGGFPFDILTASLGEEEQLSAIPMGLVRCDFMWALEKVPLLEQVFIWKTVADVVKDCIGVTSTGEIPFGWYTFDYCNYPPTIVRSVQLINNAKMIGIPSICIQPNQSADFVSTKISKPLFHLLPSEDANDIVYMKEPCGYEDLDGAFANQLIDTIRVIKRDYKEAYGRDCVVMIHLTNQNGYANVINKVIMDAFPEGGVVFGGIVTGYETHGSTISLLKSMGKDHEVFSEIDYHIRGLLDTRKEWNTGQTVKPPQGSWEPGGMGSSQAKEAADAGIEEHKISKIYSLGRFVLEEVGVTPGSQFMWQSGMIIYDKVWSNLGQLDQFGRSFEASSLNECKESIVDFCRSGHKLNLPAVVMDAISSDETVYERTSLAELILKNEPYEAQSNENVPMFDAEELRKQIEKEFNIPISDSMLASYIMYATQMKTYFKQCKDGMPFGSSVDDKLLFCKLKAGDTFDNNNYTILKKDEAPSANGYRMAIIQNNNTGDIIADQIKHPDDVGGMLLKPLAELTNPNHVGVRGQILEIEGIHVKPGDIIEKDHVLLKAKVGKVLQSVVATSDQIGRVVETVHVQNSDTNLESETLLITLSEAPE